MDSCRATRAAGPLAGFRSLLAVLAGRTDPGLELALDGQLRAVAAAAVEAHLVTTGESIAADALERSEENLAHSCRDHDEVRARLGSCVITPVDREDLLRVSRSLDRSTRALHEFIRETELFQPRSLERLVPLSGQIDQLVGHLCRMTKQLAGGSRASAEHVLRVQECALAAERAYQQQMAGLLAVEAGNESLKSIALLGRLDSVRSCLLDAYGALADGAMKRGL